MCAHHLHHRLGVEPFRIENTNIDVVGFWPNVVEAGLVFDNVLDTRKIFEGPFLIRPQASSRITVVALHRLSFPLREQPALIELTTDDMRLLPREQLELSGSLSEIDINSDTPQPGEPLVTVSAVNYVNKFVPGFETLCHEGQHDAILFLFTAEERACVTGALLDRSSQSKGLVLI